MANTGKKKVLAISGSTRTDSTNLQLIKAIALLAAADLDIEIYDKLSELPHFNPDLDQHEPPVLVKELRNRIMAADGILICTPEYVFSLPGSLKNLIEWMVSTTMLAKKPAALITAAALGTKAHEALLLIMKTVEADFNDQTQLLVSGARTKVNGQAIITDAATLEKVQQLIAAFATTLNKK